MKTPYMTPTERIKAKLADGTLKCECGNKAVDVRDNCGICARCIRIEDAGIDHGESKYRSDESYLAKYLERGFVPDRGRMTNLVSVA